METLDESRIFTEIIYILLALAMASNLLKTFGERSSHEIQRVLKEELRNFSSTQKDLIHKLYCDWETKMPGSREKNKLLLELVDHCKNGCLISSSYHPVS